VLINGAQAAVGGDDLHRVQAVDGEAQVAAGQPEATAEGDPGDAHRRTGATRDDYPVRRQSGVEVDQLGARADGDQPLGLSKRTALSRRRSSTIPLASV